MQFMVYDPNYKPEGAPPPTPELMAEMGAFIGEAMRAGALVATGSLNPKGTRLRLSEGKFTVTDGPFIELKEHIAGFYIIIADDLDDALGWARKVMEAIKSREIGSAMSSSIS